MPRIIVTGAPGTGKTSVIECLGELFDIVAEPARRAIAQHRDATGEPSLDHRPGLLVEKMTRMSAADFTAAASDRITLFDRGLPDCLAYASVYGLDMMPILELAREIRYDQPAFIAPPWRDIHANDELRRATFQEVEGFHDHVVWAYRHLGYELVALPMTSIGERAAFIAGRVISSSR